MVNKILNLKNVLKVIKLNEPTISTVLGGLIVLIIGIMLVNYIKGKPASVGNSAPATQTEQEEKVSLPKTHKVEKGEHLWKIAEKYYKSGYNWVDIAKTNNIINPGLISVGQELTIPSVEAKVATIKAEGQVSSTKAPGPSIEGDTYTIAKGDHLWSIAVRAYADGYRWVEIARENNISNSDLVYPGQKLTLSKK